MYSGVLMQREVGREGGRFLCAYLYSPLYTNSPESPYVEKLLRNDLVHMGGKRSNKQVTSPKMAIYHFYFHYIISISTSCRISPCAQADNFFPFSMQIEAIILFTEALLYAHNHPNW